LAGREKKTAALCPSLSASPGIGEKKEDPRHRPQGKRKEKALHHALRLVAGEKLSSAAKEKGRRIDLLFFDPYSVGSQEEKGTSAARKKGKWREWR